jgi:hypothetical protein
MRRLDERILHEAQAFANFKNSRLANQAQFDRVKRLRTTAHQLKIGNLVLLHNTIKHSHSRKLDDKWRGPYRIREVPEDSQNYLLEKLDGTPLAASFAGNRLKRFLTRTKLDEQREEMHDTIRARDVAHQDGNMEEEEELMDGVGSENMDALVDEVE